MKLKLKDAWHLGRKAVTNLDSILKSRDITLLTKFHLAKAMVFPVVMHLLISASCTKIFKFLQKPLVHLASCCDSISGLNICVFLGFP